MTADRTPTDRLTLAAPRLLKACVAASNLLGELRATELPLRLSRHCDRVEQIVNLAVADATTVTQ